MLHHLVVYRGGHFDSYFGYVHNHRRYSYIRELSVSHIQINMRNKTTQQFVTGFALHDSHKEVTSTRNE